MKLKRTRLSLLAFALAFAVQLSFAPPAARAAQNTNSSETMSGDHHMGIPDSRCRRRCNTSYRQCLRRGKNRRACARQLRNCQRRCPQ